MRYKIFDRNDGHPVAELDSIFDAVHTVEASAERETLAILDRDTDRILT